MFVWKSVQLLFFFYYKISNPGDLSKDFICQRFTQNGQIYYIEYKIIEVHEHLQKLQNYVKQKKNMVRCIELN